MVLTFGATIAYSRMFLGVHSLNQVCYGLSLGAWFACCIHFIFKDKIISLAQGLIDGKDDETNRLFWVSTGLMIGAYAVQILNYEAVMEFQNPAEWSLSIAKKCGSDSLSGAF